MTALASKNVWRAQMLEKRSQLGPEKIAQLNRDLCKNLAFIWGEFGHIKSPSQRPLWIGYKSFSWEADPQKAIHDVAHLVRWAFPRVLPNFELEFIEPSEGPDGSRWLKNSWGIWEPDPLTGQKIKLDDSVGVLVPGVAFDKQGRRLGYGKGFYDRALADYKGLKIGVGFGLQLTSEALPYETTDVLMDLIVTDREILRVTEVKA